MFCCRKTNIVSVIASPMHNNDLINARDVPMFSLNGYSCHAKIVNVYDGDSCKVILKFAGSLYQFNCRIAGIDAPEMKPSLRKPRRDIEIAAAIISRNRVIELCCNDPANNTKIISIDCHKFDKYGRLLITIYADGKNINDLMIEEGHAKKYDGGKKAGFNYT
jgi:endonuclease YncB( thermonuclease family)